MVTDSRNPKARANEEWITALRPPPEEHIVSELRKLIRGRLERSLSTYDLDDASLEDFTQEATLRVLDRLESFRGDSRFATWVHTLAVRVAFTELRRRRGPTRPIEDLVEAAGSRPHDVSLVPESRELLQTLRHAIDGELTERQRTVILAELAGAPSEQIAEQLGIKRNAMYKLYHDARKKLRAALLSAGYTESDVRSHLERASERKE